MLVLLLAFLLPPQQASADTKNFGSTSTMNGYSPAQFEGFQKKWHFVTVRFRKDSGEMRFTYANDSAWAALLAGGKSYPDGAVFAKIGVATQEDPAFVSSSVPSGARRIQFMVRNSKKHQNTDGWGYALFNEQGVTYPEDPKLQEIACAACHRLVPERGYVFSEKLDLENLLSPPKGPSVLPAGLPFHRRELAKLPSNVRKLIPAKYKKIFVLGGELPKQLFQGTLDEIRPALAKQAVETGAPAILMSEDGLRFSLVFADPDSKICGSEKGVALRALISSPSAGAKENNLTYCYAK